MAATPPPEADARRIVGRYRLDHELGRGAMGTVWSAYDEVLHRPVAVKEVRLSMVPVSERAVVRERTLREARATAMLSHPNVVTLYDVVEVDAEPYVVMELLPPRSLASYIIEHGTLAQPEVAEIGSAVASALAAAHRAGITHRDVKPGNVLIGEGGQIKLTDFGIARNAAESSMTQTGTVLGSPPYIAPEVAMGRTVGPAADLWGLGATLFACLEGRPPYDGGDPVATVSAVVHGDIPEPSGRGPVVDVIRGLMVKEPARRMALATVRRRLRPLLADPEGPVLSAPSGAVTTTLPRPGVDPGDHSGLIPLGPDGRGPSGTLVEGAGGAPAPVTPPATVPRSDEPASGETPADPPAGDAPAADERGVEDASGALVLGAGAAAAAGAGAAAVRPSPVKRDAQDGADGEAEEPAGSAEPTEDGGDARSASDDDAPGETPESPAVSGAAEGAPDADEETPAADGVADDPDDPPAEPAPGSEGATTGSDDDGDTPAAATPAAGDGSPGDADGADATPEPDRGADDAGRAADAPAATRPEGAGGTEDGEPGEPAEAAGAESSPVGARAGAADADADADDDADGDADDDAQDAPEDSGTGEDAGGGPDDEAGVDGRNSADGRSGADRGGAGTPGGRPPRPVPESDAETSMVGYRVGPVAEPLRRAPRPGSPPPRPGPAGPAPRPTGSRPVPDPRARPDRWSPPAPAPGTSPAGTPAAGWAPGPPTGTGASQPLAADPGPLPFTPSRPPPAPTSTRQRLVTVAVVVLLVIVAALGALGAYALTRVLAGQPAVATALVPAGPVVDGDRLVRHADTDQRYSGTGLGFSALVPVGWQQFRLQQPSNDIVVRFVSPDAAREVRVDRIGDFYPAQRAADYAALLGDPRQVGADQSAVGALTPVGPVAEGASEASQQLVYRTRSGSDDRTTWTRLVPSGTDLWVVRLTAPFGADAGAPEQFVAIADSFSPNAV